MVNSAQLFPDLYLTQADKVFAGQGQLRGPWTSTSRFWPGMLPVQLCVKVW